MKLYKNSKGVWAGTQADARKMCGKGYQTVDVPTDKPNLLKFLNLNQVGSYTSNDKQRSKMLRRVKDIVCEKCGHEFSATEHTQCPKCKEKKDEK